MLFDYKENTIRAYGLIGEGDISETMMMEALDAMGGQDITLKLQSEGGDVIAGLSIHNQLKAYPGKVTVAIDSLAASIATVIMLGGDHIEAAPTATVMIHRAWAVAMGNATDFRNMSEILDTFDGQIAELYAQKAGGTREHWFAAMDKETWLDASQALDAGLVDSISVGKPSKKQNVSAHPVASCRSFAGLGPAGKTLVQAMKMRKDLLDKGLLNRQDESR